MKTKIGVLTAGRDCAGINSAIQWITYSALDKDLVPVRGMMFDVLGIIDGWKGLVEVKPEKKDSLKRWTVPLTPDLVRTWDRSGGTRLGTTVINPFDPKKDQSGLMMENMKKLGIEALVVIGGIDNLGVAYKLFREGVKVVGVPKTIDKDLSETEYTLGGEASGAAITLIPEHDFVMERVTELLVKKKKEGKRYSIVVVAEGAKPRGLPEVLERRGQDGFGRVYLGGIGGFITETLEKTTNLEVRYVALRHLQRGGSPSAYDRRMCRKYGIAAVDMIANEDFGRMVSLKQGEITTVPLRKALEHLSLVDVEKYYNTMYYRSKDRVL
jgi:6-phosphofructokinase